MDRHGLLFVLTLAACTSEVRVFITDPPRGAQLGEGEIVTLAVDAWAPEVVVTAGADEPLLVHVPGVVTTPAARGLGFASARIEGDPLIAVRSWQQGRFHRPDTFLDDALTARLGEKALNRGPAAVTRILETMLRGRNLARFVREPITFDLDVVVGDVDVEIVPSKVVAQDVRLRLGIEDSVLTLEAVLVDVELEYRADAGRFTAPGAAVIEEILLVSEVALTTSGASLRAPKVDASEPVITDGGRFPESRLQLLAPRLRRAIEGAFAGAAELAVDQAIHELLDNLRPRVGLDFDKPISQQTRLREVRPEGESILLRYDALVRAVSADHRAERGFLDPGVPIHEDGAGATLRVGHRVMNQFAHAAWAAGNFHDILFTRDELHRLGLPSLSFPYSRLRSVTVSMSLAPTFAWRTDGAWVELGGVVMDINIRGAKDVLGYTAGRVPIDLCPDGLDFRLCIAHGGEVEVLDVEFNKLHDFADRDAAVRLMEAAAQGVVNRILGTLPTIEVPTLLFSDINSRPVMRVRPQVSAVDTGPHGWLIDLELLKAPL